MLTSQDVGGKWRSSGCFAFFLRSSKLFGEPSSFRIVSFGVERTVGADLTSSLMLALIVFRWARTLFIALHWFSLSKPKLFTIVYTRSRNKRTFLRKWGCTEYGLFKSTLQFFLWPQYNSNFLNYSRAVAYNFSVQFCLCETKGFEDNRLLYSQRVSFDDIILGLTEYTQSSLTDRVYRELTADSSVVTKKSMSSILTAFFFLHSGSALCVGLTSKHCEIHTCLSQSRRQYMRCDSLTSCVMA